MIDVTAMLDRRVLLVETKASLRQDDQEPLLRIDLNAFRDGTTTRRVPDEQIAIKLTMDQVMYFTARLDRAIHDHIYNIQET